MHCTALCERSSDVRYSIEWRVRQLHWAEAISLLRNNRVVILSAGKVTRSLPPTQQLACVVSKLKRCGAESN